MTDKRIIKLVKLGISSEVAQDLVDAGYSTPKLIKATTAEQLENAIGSENVATVETRFGIQRE